MAVDICHIIMVVMIAIIFEPVLCASWCYKELVNRYCFSHFKDEKCDWKYVLQLMANEETITH